MLGTASATGKDIFARVAAIMDEPLMSDVLGVNITEKTVRKSHFSGKIMATLKVDAPVLLCTIRPNVIEPTPKPAAGNMVTFEVGVADPGLTKITEVQKGDSSKLDLTEAPVIVTGSLSPHPNRYGCIYCPEFCSSQNESPIKKRRA